jgi:hypothetical protein
LLNWAGGAEASTAQSEKVFCFFFSKKKLFPSLKHARPSLKNVNFDRVGFAVTGSIGANVFAPLFSKSGCFPASS